MAGVVRIGTSGFVYAVKLNRYLTHTKRGAVTADFVYLRFHGQTRL